MWLSLIIAVSLSMDSFSLSLIYGTLGMSRKQKVILSFFVGLFHFFMPILGFLFGYLFLSIVKINFDILVALILSFIGIDMIISSFKEDEIICFNKFFYFIFSLAVSIDSFSVGITFNGSDSFIFAPIIFACVSFIFTIFGLFLGGKTYDVFGKLSTVVGGIVLIVIGVFYLI